VSDSKRSVFSRTLPLADVMARWMRYVPVDLKRIIKGYAVSDRGVSGKGEERAFLDIECTICHVRFESDRNGDIW